jgi:hypothetical protein
MKVIERRRHQFLGAFAAMAIFWHGLGGPCPAADGPGVAAVLEKLHFREIGPAVMGGRIDDIAVVERDPRIVYIGTASGGLWKTENSGTTWQPLFDKQPVPSIGDVTVAPSDPSIV